MHPQSRPQPRPSERGPGPRHTDYDDEEVEDDDDDDDGAFADGEGEPCPNCGRVYRYSSSSHALSAMDWVAHICCDQNSKQDLATSHGS